MPNKNSELEKNLAAFREQLPKLLEDNEGRYAVGRADDNFECWDTYRDGLQYGYKKYGKKQFLIKKVQYIEIPQFARIA